MLRFDFKKNYPVIIGTVLVVLAGIGVGWFLSGNTSLTSNKGVAPGAVNTSKEAGMVPQGVEADTATGKLIEGGTNGKGTHHLEREGGASKNVYLTSSVIDLQSFVGKDVEVWGQTFAAEKSIWLMDVFKVKVVE